MAAQLITAVAFYGPKPGALRDLTETVQGMLRERLGARFRPYTLDQVHGTVIRLDGFADPLTGAAINQRYLDAAGARRPMDHGLALEILASHLTPPVRLRIGGFQPGEPATFTSRGRPPWERSFAVSRDAFVLMGWPESTIAGGDPVRPLDDLRRDLSKANVLHWYHDDPTSVDNDLHLVVGHRGNTTERDTAEAVQAVRTYLAGNPVHVAVGIDQISVIASESLTLAPAQFVGRLPLDPAQIARLYR